MRPMTHLLLVLELSAMSKLLSARSKPPSTLSGHSFNPLENRFTQNPKKSLIDQTFTKKFCLSTPIRIRVIRGFIYQS